MPQSNEHLMDIWGQLGPGDRATLLAFAEFLRHRSTPGAVVAPARAAAIPEPVAIERPQGESVVAGLKRLSKTYPMLDKSEMLSATSDLVALHIMQGTEAREAIDKLEAIFSEHYRRLKEAHNSPP
ncbi:MAG: Crp/Fnr family transcriptional regulator [Pseudomonadota bacterium]|nr:Crp/Fnr family transcriptional regulator [Pseudomonadota bacterium]